MLPQGRGMEINLTKVLTKEEWLKKKRFKKLILYIFTGILFLVVLGLSVIIINIAINRWGSNNNGKEVLKESLSNGKVIQQHYLTPNTYSRPQIKLKRINGVVVHYTANPGTSADNNRSYFEGLRTKKTAFASSHYIIGLEGEILQCIPLTEEAYASNNRNKDTVSIECCHPDETGKFNSETYDSLVALTAAICIEFKLEEKDIIRHYDVTGKLCPLYYVEHEDAWNTFKADVMRTIDEKR